MTTAVDSMVVIDLFQNEPKWAPRAATAIDHAIRSGRLLACDVVWAEVAGRFASDQVLAAAMADLSIDFDGITAAAAARAGRLWRIFRQSGGARRERIVPDFLVGAHALERADVLLTRDRGFYRRYFKGLHVIEP